jgi:ribosomal protein S12 methylthiotransferase accessory factor
MMEFVSRLKTHGERCVQPAETIARLEAFVGSRHDFWIHEESVSPDLHWAAMFLEGLEFRSMGKGTTLEAARAGALAEGAEWLTSRATGDLPSYTWGRQEDFSNALRLEDLLGHIANANPSLVRRLQALEVAGHWVDGCSLIDGSLVKVPLEYVRLISGPNGKASGNSLEEAVIHAAYEILERRVHITVLRNRMPMPTIDPSTISLPVVRRQMEFLQGKGIEFTIKNLSWGGALPCLGVYFRDTTIPQDFQFHHFFKVGTSFDLEEALVRAFTEYTQGRKATEFLDPNAPDYSNRLATLLDHDFRRIGTLGNDCDNFMSAFMFGMVPYRNADFLLEGDIVPFHAGVRHADCLNDIAAAKDAFTSLGLNLIAVDLTDPAIGFPVVQLIAPGYSDVLPYHPPNSPTLFRPVTRTEVLESYPSLPTFIK